MAVPCKRSEPVLTHFKNGLELRKLNKKITLHVKKDNNYEIVFVRVLDKEERILLKKESGEDLPNLFIARSKLLISKINFTMDTLCDLAAVLEYFGEIAESLEYVPEEELKADTNE